MKPLRLAACLVSFADANAYVRRHHRHHEPVRGQKFSIGAALDGRLVSVVMVGRPVARMRQEGLRSRLRDSAGTGPRNACNFLYGRAARAAFAMGYLRLGTYIVASEDGARLRAAGWRPRSGGEPYGIHISWARVQPCWMALKWWSPRSVTTGLGLP